MTSRTTAVAALAVVAVAGGLATASADRLSAAHQRSDDRTGALHAAQQIAVDFAAYDYRHIDRDFARVVAESTGTFKQQFATQSAGVRDLIVQVKAVSTAEAVSAGLVSAGSRSAVAVVALNRTVANTKVPKGTTDAFGVQITLLRVHGRWLASAVKPL